MIWIAFAHADVIEVETTPTEVTVFADRARITRVATVDLPKGRHQVSFGGLPASALSDTITADAAGNLRLGGVDVRRVTASEAADLRVKEIEAELEALGDKRIGKSDEQAAARAQLAAVEQSRAQAAAALNSQLLVADRAPERARALRAELAAQETAAREAVRVAGVAVRELDQQIAALQRERSTLGSSATDTWSAAVNLDVKKAARIEVKLHYLATGASWQPRYDIRGKVKKGEVELGLSAMIRQNTGEDWTDVELTVSSAQPGLGTDVPLLDPFWLQRPVYDYGGIALDSVAGAAPARKGRSRAAEKSSAPAPAPAPPMEIVQAVVQVQLAATAFTVPHDEDVPSDGTERKVLLTTEQLEADLRYTAAPRLDPRAYLVGKVTNTADFPLLAGVAGVFRGGAYLGDFALQTVAPGDKFDVAFGVDDRVTIQRKPNDVEQGKKAVVGKRASSKWLWDLKLANGHQRAITVELWEQIPLATRDDVKVNLQIPKSALQPEEKDGGLLRFETKLAAGAKKTVSWGYSIDYPSDLSFRWLE